MARVMQQIKFAKPDFPLGENITVRLGTGKAKTLTVGGILQLTDQDGEPQAKAVCEWVWAGPICLMPLHWLPYEHDEDARTLRGLKAVLKECYPDEEIDNDTIVSVVGFFL